MEEQVGTNQINGVSSEKEIHELIQKEYIFYSEEVKPWVDGVEISFGATPDGLLNEIRNFMGHISEAAINTKISFPLRVANVADAHKHLRRILLDCYKLMCIYNQDVIKGFYKKFRFYDLSEVDDGNFLVNLRNYKKKAESAFQNAKRNEGTGKNRDDLNEEKLGKVYEEYSMAYNCYAETVTYIEDHYDGILRVVHKHILGKFLSVMGWAISILLAIFSLCHGK